MGDTEETVANQVTEVIEVDKVDEQQPVDAEKEGKKRKVVAPRSSNSSNLSQQTAEKVSAFDSA